MTLSRGSLGERRIFTFRHTTGPSGTWGTAPESASLGAGADGHSCGEDIRQNAQRAGRQPAGT